MSVRLFVGNLSYQATEAEVREHFSAVGPLVFLHLPTDRDSGWPRGRAFVEFHDPAHAEEAIRRFHTQPFQGRPLVVNHARAREPGPGVPRHASASPPLSSGQVTEPHVTAPRPSHRGEARREFGPDAAPRRQRKPAQRRPPSTRPRKGPIRERQSGQFFGGGEAAADNDASSEGQLHPSHAPSPEPRRRR
jgi:cold-inducible RNA-binding protein